MYLATGLLHCQLFKENFPSVCQFAAELLGDGHADNRI